MLRSKSAARDIIHFIKQNVFIIIFIVIILIVGVVSVLKILKNDSENIYVKVKVSQGLWWAFTQQPSIWYLKNLKPGIKQINLSGKVESEILEVRYYPGLNHNEYDVYVTIKAKANKNSRTGLYTIDRQEVITASPIEFIFPTSLVTGTIMDVSIKPFDEKYIEKTIVLEKQFATEWEFEQIPVGDKYFDGKDTIITIIDKKASDTFSLFNGSPDGYPASLTPRKNITITAKIKVKKELNQLIMSESQLIQPGKILNLATNNYRFVDYKIVNVK